jgi:HEAT repeat protein
MAVIEKRTDEVRAPALRALANIGPAEAIPAITRLIKNSEANMPEIRAIACRTVGEILLRTRASKVPDETYEALVTALRDKSPLVQAAAGAALGMSPIQAEERYKAFKKGRVNPR